MEKGIDQRKVLITGITGFLGTHIAKLLLEKGYFVRGTVRDPKNSVKLAPLKEFPQQDHLEIVVGDLLKAETWEPAVSGCDYVIHTAAPVTLATPKDESVIITPMVEGMKAILAACAKCKEVKGIVITSSVATVLDLSDPSKKIFSEADWANVEGNFAYGKGKTLEEKIAWDFYNSMDSSHRIRMTVINPSYIMGPSLLKTEFSSSYYTKKLLTGEMKLLPKLLFTIVDVRDVALAHLLALENPIADGKRYICFSGEHMWIRDIAQELKTEFAKFGYNVSCEEMQECPAKDKADVLYLRWAKTYKLVNELIKKELGMTFRSAKEAILELAHSLIKQGIVENKMG